MEAGTAPAGSAHGTGSKTMADLGLLAARKFADSVALKQKVGDQWVEISYAEFGRAHSEIGRGLIDLGLQPGDRVAILSHTRPEWVFANHGTLAAGCASVAIYQTNSPEECHYVLSHSESRAVFVEDVEQLAKIRAVEHDLPSLEHIIVFDPGDGDIGDAISLDELRVKGGTRDEGELEQRATAVTDDDACLYIYT